VGPSSVTWTAVYEARSRRVPGGGLAVFLLQLDIAALMPELGPGGPYGGCRINGRTGEHAAWTRSM